MRHKCSKCNFLAVWYYAPWSREKIEHESYYCEDHVSRGCSCNIIDWNNPDATEQHKDEQGRLLPCCEYDWNEEGFEICKYFGMNDEYDHIAEEFDKD